jgi:hypothetical protein
MRHVGRWLLRQPQSLRSPAQLDLAVLGLLGACHTKVPLKWVYIHQSLRQYIHVYLRSLLNCNTP